MSTPQAGDAITTAEELDALPIGAVVLCNGVGPRMTRILALAAALASLAAATVVALAAREAALAQAARGLPAHAKDAMRALSPDGEW